MLKSTATVMVVIHVGVLIGLFGSAFPGTGNQPVVKAVSDSSCFWLSLPSRDAKETKVNQFCKVTILEIFPKQVVATSQRIRGYFLNNDVHYNLPLITYKFPLSEHTEEG